MIGKALAVALMFSAATFAHAQCGAVRTSKTALTAVHTARLASARELQAAVDEWLPEALRQIENGTSDVLWFKAAVVMSSELVGLNREDEARAVLETIGKSESRVAGRWLNTARRQLAELDGKGPSQGK